MEHTMDTQDARVLALLPGSAIEIADKLSTTRDSVSSTLRKLKRQGRITTKSGLWMLDDDDTTEEEPEDVDDGPGDDEEGEIVDGDIEIRMGGTSFTITVGEKPVTITLRRVR